jgi:hypothetical protein
VLHSSSKIFIGEFLPMSNLIFGAGIYKEKLDEIAKRILDEVIDYIMDESR